MKKNREFFFFLLVFVLDKRVVVKCVGSKGIGQINTRRYAGRYL